MRSSEIKKFHLLDVSDFPEQMLLLMVQRLYKIHLADLIYTRYGFIRNRVKSQLVSFLNFSSFSTSSCFLILPQMSTIVSYVFSKIRKKKKLGKKLDFFYQERVFFNQHLMVKLVSYLFSNHFFNFLTQIFLLVSMKKSNCFLIPNPQLVGIS